MLNDVHSHDALMQRLEQRHILVVDDDPVCCHLYVRLLESSQARVTCAYNLADMHQAMTLNHFDLVLLDLFLGHDFGIDGIKFLAKNYPRTPAAVITAHESIDMAVVALNEGASGYIVKTENPKALLAKVASMLVPVPQEWDDAAYAELGFVGASAAARDIMTRIHRIRNVDATVLVTGESGTGKEVVARAIHQSSLRSRERFLGVNCATFNDSLLESELFGYRKGAFTGAHQDRKGFFEECTKGTLFLDEIGELSPSLQAKLLRVLQEKEVLPLGSCQPLKVQTRVIVATNRDLEKCISEGSFRRDLYYRISILTLPIPPLRERKEDIPSLIEYFIDKLGAELGKPLRKPSRGEMTRLRSYRWPGNVRELRNAVERAAIYSENGQLRITDMLPKPEKAERVAWLSSEDHANRVHDDPSRGQRSREMQNRDAASSAAEPPLTTFVEAKRAFEESYLRRLLQQCRGNVTEAARVSGQYRANLYRLIKKHGIPHSSHENPSRYPPL